jgi:hypothetical protein
MGGLFRNWFFPERVRFLPGARAWSIAFRTGHRAGRASSCFVPPSCSRGSGTLLLFPIQIPDGGESEETGGKGDIAGRIQWTSCHRPTSAFNETSGGSGRSTTAWERQSTRKGQSSRSFGS